MRRRKMMRVRGMFPRPLSSMLVCGRRSTARATAHHVAAGPRTLSLAPRGGDHQSSAARNGAIVTKNHFFCSYIFREQPLRWVPRSISPRESILAGRIGGLCLRHLTDTHAALTVRHDISSGAPEATWNSPPPTNRPICLLPFLLLLPLSLLPSLCLR